jgi:hypothetical protein
MYSVKRLKIEIPELCRALQRFLSGSFIFVLLALGAPCVLAQQPGIGIFTEPYDTIYVPGKPGEIPSAPTVQAAIDQAKGRTFISVTLSESPGFLAEGKEIAVGFAGTTVTSSMTFIGCSRAIIIGYPNFTTAAMIAFVKCQNILVQFGETGRILIEDSNYGHIHLNTINGGLLVRRSSGIAISQNLFTLEAPSLIIRDCNDPPSASPPPADWAQYSLPYPVSVAGCTFQKIGPTLTPTPAALLVNSRVSMRECKFEDLEVRGIESHSCQDVSLQYNTFNKIKESAILFFNSEGLAQGNKLRGIASGDFTPGIGIYVATVGEKPSRRSRVRVEQNEIYDAENGIVAQNATANITGNSVFGGSFGVIAKEGTDGSIVGGLFRGIKFYAMVISDVAPGFLVENTTMDSVEGYGLLVYNASQVLVKNVEWRAQCDEGCDRLENIRQPLMTGGIHIIASEVTLDYVRIGSRLTGAVLLVEAGFAGKRSIVQCSQSLFTAQGTGTGVIIDGSTLTGNLSSWSDGPSFIAQYKAEVSLAGGERIRSNLNTALTVQSESSFELTASPGFIERPDALATMDLVSVSGASKIHLTNLAIASPNGGALVHLTGGSKGLFEGCELSGSRVAEDRSQQGPPDGYLVEDDGSIADVRNGKIYHQGGIGIRALFGGQVKANGLLVNMAKTYVQIDAGGKAEFDSCTLGETPGALTSVRVNAGGETIIRNSAIGYFFDYGIKVLAGGKCELINCSIHNGATGLHIEPGATLSQSGTRFTDVNTEVAGVVPGGSQ